MLGLLGLSGLSKVIRIIRVIYLLQGHDLERSQWHLISLFHDGKNRITQLSQFLIRRNRQVHVHRIPLQRVLNMFLEFGPTNRGLEQTSVDLVTRWMHFHHELVDHDT